MSSGSFLQPPPLEGQRIFSASGQPSVAERLRRWQETDFAARLWGKDPLLWSAVPAVPELVDRLGWLQLPEDLEERAAEYRQFAAEIRAEGFLHVLLLGMGGSSLAPEVFQRTFGNRIGHPELLVLDSTHPGAVRSVDGRIDPERTLFVVSSKSGTTTEPLAFFQYFWERAGKRGGRFVAITDPGTPLELLAREHGFRRTFAAPADVGGRYSALTAFGLIPAALIGVDLARLSAHARNMAGCCLPGPTAAHNPGLALGAALGELALAGRDKLTFLPAPSLAALPDWIEQLIAESTGKDGRGIVPIVGEPAAGPELYAGDRVFVDLGLEGEEEERRAKLISALQAAGHPVISIRIPEMEALGAEFFRWEFATAAAGAVLGIHPFNQPDVQMAKELAARAMKDTRSTAAAAGEVFEAGAGALGEAISRWLSDARPGDYVALQAFLAPAAETGAALRDIRVILRDRLRLATTVGFGPRFLHSTGQLHKGGPNTGLFLQLTDVPAVDVRVPARDFTFGMLVQAQAAGDAGALRGCGRRLLRVTLGDDVAGGLRRLCAALGG